LLVVAIVVVADDVEAGGPDAPGARPWFPHAVLGQSGAFSPLMQAPVQRALPSDPDHRLQLTSLHVPNNAPWPEGKKTLDPPVSSQISKCTGMLNWFD